MCVCVLTFFDKRLMGGKSHKRTLKFIFTAALAQMKRWRVAAGDKKLSLIFKLICNMLDKHKFNR